MGSRWVQTKEGYYRGLPLLGRCLPAFTKKAETSWNTCLSERFQTSCAQCFSRRNCLDVSRENAEPEHGEDYEELDSFSSDDSSKSASSAISWCWICEFLLRMPGSTAFCFKHILNPCTEGDGTLRAFRLLLRYNVNMHSLFFIFFQVLSC